MKPAANGENSAAAARASATTVAEGGPPSIAGSAAQAADSIADRGVKVELSNRVGRAGKLPDLNAAASAGRAQGSIAADSAAEVLVKANDRSAVRLHARVRSRVKEHEPARPASSAVSTAANRGVRFRASAGRGAKAGDSRSQDGSVRVQPSDQPGPAGAAQQISAARRSGRRIRIAAAARRAASRGASGGRFRCAIAANARARAKAAERNDASPASARVRAAPIRHARVTIGKALASAANFLLVRAVSVRAANRRASLRASAAAGPLPDLAPALVRVRRVPAARTAAGREADRVRVQDCAAIAAAAVPVARLAVDESDTGAQ